MTAAALVASSVDIALTVPNIGAITLMLLRRRRQKAAGSIVREGLPFLLFRSVYSILEDWDWTLSVLRLLADKLSLGREQI